MHLVDVLREHLGWCPNGHPMNRVYPPGEIHVSNLSIPGNQVPVPGVGTIQYRYYHTQPNLAGGRKTTYLLAICALVIFSAVMIGVVPVLLIPVFMILALLALVNALFSSLTVAISGDLLEFWFGMKVWHRKFLLAKIVGCQVVKNLWWYGWGIRWTPHGWLYNVAGPNAVEIVFMNGKKIRIGTDEPVTLAEAINHALY